jgi:uncharacterized membrane protein YjjB (DUF3815 family)
MRIVIMDKATAVSMLGGTIARGLLWATAALSTQWGIDNLDKNTGEAVGFFLAAAIVSLLSTWWSKRKNNKLLTTEPPKTQ